MGLSDGVGWGCLVPHGLRWILTTYLDDIKPFLVIDVPCELTSTSEFRSK